MVARLTLGFRFCLGFGFGPMISHFTRNTRSGDCERADYWHQQGYDFTVRHRSPPLGAISEPGGLVSVGHCGEKTNSRRPDGKFRVPWGAVDDVMDGRCNDTYGDRAGGSDVAPVRGKLKSFLVSAHGSFRLMRVGARHVRRAGRPLRFRFLAKPGLRQLFGELGPTRRRTMRLKRGPILYAPLYGAALLGSLHRCAQLDNHPTRPRPH